MVGKGYSTKWWWGTSEAQKPAWQGSAGSLMAETVYVWTAKQAVTLDIASPDTCQCLKLPFEPFTSP